MSLKQSIVIVNEFTVKTSKGGTRGGTPGDYIMRYMARKGAVEDLTPVKLQDQDDFIVRYMARKEATETLDSVPEIKHKMRKAQGNGGVAFSNNNPSLSDEALKRRSKEIQAAFDKNKTVMKTVISFDEEYLKEMGIIDPDFEFLKEGDYRGNIDQMKLRQAIMSGMDRMSRDYDDLRYIGVIQVDTKHVHCHLAMADFGEGNLMPDGSQRGKISDRSKQKLRRGIDMYLDENQVVQQMTSSITHDKRNAKCFIKKYAHKTMAEHGTPQFLMACLPDDKRKWRADTNDKTMRKANAIVREYVMDVLSLPGSGYKEAVRDIYEYAAHRKRREGLSDKEHRRLIENGQERVIRDCMNGVYSVLKQIPDDQRNVQTSMLNAMSMDYYDMSASMDSDPLLEFGFKLRSYSSRLDHHKKERRKYHDMAKEYEELPDDEKSEDSRMLYDFFKVEEEYNEMLMSKYQHFLSFLPPGEEYMGDFNALLDYGNQIKSLESMRNDKTFKRLGEDSAEDYGKQVYNMSGGRYVIGAPSVLEARQSNMQQKYDGMREEFDYKLSEYGLAEKDGKIIKHEVHPFDDVKALDLHHLGYDFSYEFSISQRNIENFTAMANKRFAYYQEAKAYLIGSGQEDVLADLPGRDIEQMKKTADSFGSSSLFVPKSSNSSTTKRKTNTVSMDNNYDEMISDVIQNTVKSIQLY